MISKSGKLLLPGDQDALNTLPIVLFCTPLSHTHKEIAFGCWETINCSLIESILTAFSQKRKKTSFTLLFKTYLLFMYLCLHLPERLKYRKDQWNWWSISIAIQCNLDLVTLDLVATCDLVTSFQRSFFNLLHKIIWFSDIMQFSDSFCETKNVTKSILHCIYISRSHRFWWYYLVFFELDNQ